MIRCRHCILVDCFADLSCFQVRSNDGATKALDGNSSLSAGDAHLEAVTVSSDDHPVGSTGANHTAGHMAQGDAHIEGDVETPCRGALAGGDSIGMVEGNCRVQEGDHGAEGVKGVEGDFDDDCEVDHDHVQDTVGVVVLDQAGNVASTVSSGGIALKQPGRWGKWIYKRSLSSNQNISGLDKLPVLGAGAGLRSLPGLVPSPQLLSVLLVSL